MWSSRLRSKADFWHLCILEDLARWILPLPVGSHQPNRGAAYWIRLFGASHHLLLVPTPPDPPSPLQVLLQLTTLLLCWPK